MIEVLNVNPIKKGSLLASCDVHILPWQCTFRKVKIFEKGANRWINLPSEEYTDETGEKKYFDLVRFDTPAIKERFRDQVMVQINAYLDKNPNLEAPDVIKSNSADPF
jgi:hypothetical protein